MGEWTMSITQSYESSTWIYLVHCFVKLEVEIICSSC